MENIKLKPCPFCGNDIIKRYDFGKHVTYACENDNCQISVRADSEQEALDKWNRRFTQTDKILSLLDKMIANEYAGIRVATLMTVKNEINKLK